MPELGVGQAQGIHLASLANCKYPTDIEPSARWFVDDYVVPLIEHSGPGVFDQWDNVVVDKPAGAGLDVRSEEHTSELQSHLNLVCRLLLEKKKSRHQIL